MSKVAWIGLGVMGSAMAGHLLERGGHDVTVYNRNRAKAEAWRARYGRGEIAGTPAAAANGAEFVFACVGNDDDVRSITVGPDGAFQSMPHNAVFIDHTTASASVARELSAAAGKHGLHFLDCPVSGGQAGAGKGILTVMCGGGETAFKRAEPLMTSYARMISLIGPSGAGQLTKMVNQIAIAGLLQGLSEAIGFAEKAGLDVESVIDTISKGAAQSWQMENRWRTMTDRSFEFGFAVDWMRKDLGICFDEATRNGSDLPIARAVDMFYADVQLMGGGRWDTSSLIARLGPADGSKPSS